MPSYLIESYLPRSRSAELPAAVGRLRRAAEALTAEGAPVRHLRTTFLPGQPTRRFIMRTLKTLTGLAICAAVATGCGEADTEAPAATPQVTAAERQAQLERDPYDLRCADLSDKVASARMSRIAQYALADDAEIPGLNRLRASQSIFYAITEVCNGKPGAFQPARPAIDGVRSGEYRADLGTP